MTDVPAGAASSGDVDPKSLGETAAFGGETPAAGARDPSLSPALLPSEIPVELQQHPRYRLLSLLGRGGMGDVYLAEHIKMRRQVAIKVIRPQYLHDRVATQRFQQEVRAAAHLNHRHIVTAYDADEAGALHFLVMEYVPGMALDEYVRSCGPLPPAEACEYIRQAALGLQHAHELGMVHRDIKPQNLMRTANAEIKILDFGLARLTQNVDLRNEAGPINVPDTAWQVTQHGVLVGTVDYMAPEQATGAADSDGRADLYSLGCTLFYLLVGRPPFVGGTVYTRLAQHAQENPDFGVLPEAVSPALRAILQRLLAKSPAERFQSPGELATALADAANLASPSAIPRPGLYRNRILGLGTLVACCAGLALLLGSYLISPGIAPIPQVPSTDRTQVANATSVIAPTGTVVAASSPPAPTTQSDSVGFHIRSPRGEPPAPLPVVVQTLQAATLAETQRWLEGLADAGLRPIHLSIVAGSDELRFCALAVPNPRQISFDFRLQMNSPTSSATWKEMIDKKYRHLVAQKDWRNNQMYESQIWIKDPRPWLGFGGPESFIRGKIEASRGQRMFPLQLSATQGPRGPDYTCIFTKATEPDCAAQLQLTAAELQQQVADQLDRGWRPATLAAFQMGSELRFALVSFQNASGTPFAFHFDMPAAAHAEMLAADQRAGLRPNVIAGYVVAGETRFTSLAFGDPPQGQVGETALPKPLAP